MTEDDEYEDDGVIHPLKPRSILTAKHLHEIMENICDVLEGFKRNSLDEYRKYSLCLSHYGKIEIQETDKLNAVFSCGLVNFYHFLSDTLTPGIIIDSVIKYKRCLEFTKQMICESMYDREYSLRCYYGPQWSIEERPGTWLNDPHLEEVFEQYNWIDKYKKIAHDDLYILMEKVRDETEIEGIHFYFLKEYLLENIFDLKGYMPSRYDKYRYDYKKIFEEQLHNEIIDELIEKGRIIKPRLTYIVNKAMPEVNLFTESKVEDIVNHIINVYVSYHYYKRGKFIWMRNDVN